MFKEFAKAFFKEAERDFRNAELMFEREDYAASTFFAQQTVEKCGKALLELKERYVFNHGIRVSVLLREAYSDVWNEEFEFVARSIEDLSEFYIRARYPTLFLGKVYLPSELITREIAEESLEKARKVLEITRKVLENEGVI